MRYRVEVGTAQKRRLYSQVTWWFGDFYDGDLDQILWTGAWNPTPLVTVAFTGERNIGRLPAGKSAKPPTVLFMCPHGAATSVLSSAYFQRLAKERGFNVHVVSAGTDPDPQVAPAVARHLTKRGYEVPVSKPRLVTADDVAAADVVISIGCDLKDLPAPQGTLLRWDDVPALSEDFARADEKIRERVIQLLEELVRKQPR